MKNWEDFEKCKMQPLMQNYSYFTFLFEKGNKQFLNFVYLQKTKILILHLIVAMKTILPSNQIQKYHK